MGQVYVTNYGSTTASVIDTTTNKVTATVPVGNHPFGVAVNSDGTKAYVTNDISGTVSVIDTATNKVTVTVKVEYQYPGGVAVNPDGTKVYVTSGKSNNVSVIDTASNTVTATVSVGKNSHGVAVSPDGKKVYVADEYSNNVSVIDTATNAITATVPVGNWPYGVAFSPDGKKVYVTNDHDNTVSVIDTATNTVTTTVSVGKHPKAFGQFIGSPPASKEETDTTEKPVDTPTEKPGYTQTEKPVDIQTEKPEYTQTEKTVDTQTEKPELKSTEDSEGTSKDQSNSSSASVNLHGEKTKVVNGEDILLKLSAVNLITKPTMHVQAIIIPPSGMSVSSSEFVESGAGQYTTTYDIEPGKGRDIEVKIAANQVGDFNVTGRVVYYFGENKKDVEDHTLDLLIQVESSEPQPTPEPASGPLNNISGLGVASSVLR